MEDIIMWVWLGLIVLFVILEAVTAELVAIWFVAGSLAAFVTSLLNGSIWLQITLFIAVSAIVLFAVRPMIIKRSKVEKTPTNADMNIGKTAVVIEPIDNDVSKGRVEVSGLTWLAVSEDGRQIEKDSKVTVKAIEGVKLIVARQEKE